jgi:hypothetical protein
MRILNFQRWKLPPSNFSMTFKDSIWKDDILFFTNVKTNTLSFSIQRKCKWENFKLKNLLMFEDLTWNLSHSIAICHKTKPLQETLKDKNLKFDSKLVTLAKNSLWHTWNLKLLITWKTSLAHTSNLNIETLNNLKNSLRHTFSNFNVETLNNLKNSLRHTFSNFNVETLNNLKNSLSHPLNLKLET